MPNECLSVVMPVYNGERFLRDAIATVHCGDDAEVIIIDDGSTDDTPALVRQLGLHSVRQENRGPAAARNRAVELARGEFIAFLDADDLWSDSHPARALAELHRTGADLVFGETQCISDDGAFGPRFHTFQLGSAVCRRELFERVGRFNETMRTGEDVEWFLRVRDSGAVITTIGELSLFYRLHEGNRSRIHHGSRAGLLSALQQSIARRRQP